MVLPYYGIQKSVDMSIGGDTTITVHSLCNFEKGTVFIHRLDGPAVIYPSGKGEWWYYGKKVNVQSQEQFEKFLKMKAFW